MAHDTLPGLLEELDDVIARIKAAGLPVGALESADLLQGDLDSERARERWDAERGNEP